MSTIFKIITLYIYFNYTTNIVIIYNKLLITILSALFVLQEWVVAIMDLFLFINWFVLNVYNKLEGYIHTIIWLCVRTC